VTEQPLGLTKLTSLEIDAAEAAITEALADEGFGILTEIDVAATLKQKIDVDRSPFKILGACNPHLAHRALDHDEAIGLLLPCNVTLAATAEGTRVSIVDPVNLLGLAGSTPEMVELANAARTQLERALATIA